MKFTKEQYDEMGKLYLDDLPFDDSDTDLMLELFNNLPDDLQGTAVSWGFNDTVFREDLFEYLLETQFGWTPKEYYDHHYRDFEEQGCFDDNPIEIDFTKL
jgi:hypothetical protein